MALTIPDLFKSSRAPSKFWTVRFSANDQTPALPLKCLVPPAEPPRKADSERQQKVFSDLLQNLMSHLQQAERHAASASDPATEPEKRRLLLREGKGCYEKALRLLERLRSLALHMGLTERRRFRAVAGAPQWRSLRPALAK